ncbi:MAG: hypothetical protein ABIO55_14455 [Ginsengibacter sp.]
MNEQKHLFGERDKFAIEIEQGITGIKGYMKLWFLGASIGDNKRQSEFIHAIFDCRKLIKTSPLLYEDCFENMTVEQIWEYVLPEDLIWSEKQEDLQEATRRQIYIRFLGDQFDEICSFISFVKDDIITWAISFSKRHKSEYKSYKINLKDYKKAASEFTTWFNSNLADRYPSYVK